MIKEASTSSSSRSTSGTSKYLTFRVGNESYGIPVLKALEITRVPDITLVPQMPAYIKGVINLRGRIIPIADLRQRFGLSRIETDERTCIVVVQVALPGGGKTQLGLMVDAVEEVVNLTSGDIEAPPDFGSQIDIHYISGMAKLKDEVKTLLDIDRLLTTAETERVAAV